MSPLDTSTRIHRPAEVVERLAARNTGMTRYPTDLWPGAAPVEQTEYRARHRLENTQPRNSSRHHVPSHERTQLIRPLPPLPATAPPLGETRRIMVPAAQAKIPMPLTRAPLTGPEAETAIGSDATTVNVLERILRKLRVTR
ncbi:hypothetical protein [Actinoplanes sp. NPDC051494]|uniref:hypothetical protein n=1 Tax=Actinoplanes sp. NPDC051494 TaxID=3363907 RepID=UPI0037ACBEDD